ncbi:MAG: hypothetical protein HKO08_02235 [Erythrobacter sp.]|nr:hypothetical protein [Erythrobacter sp.]
MARLLCLSSALLAAGCVPAPDSTPSPDAAATSPSSPAQSAPEVPRTMAVTRDPNAPPAPTFENWLDAPRTQGDWTYTGTARKTSATFGEAGSKPRFAILCDLDTRRITLARIGITLAEGMPMTIKTEALERNLPTLTPDRSVAETIAYISPDDPLLDAMALSRGRFAVETSYLTLYLPAWAEVTRVIEDCR